MGHENNAKDRIAVVTDSAAALHPELVERLSARGNFVVVPMPVTIRTPGAFGPFGVGSGCDGRVLAVERVVCTLSSCLDTAGFFCEWASCVFIVI